MDVLIKFRHGLGDAVQLTSVVAHLRHHHPEWHVDVAALPGKHSAFHGLARNVFVLDRQRIRETQYDRVSNLDWHECATCFPDWPSTKAERCLLDVFDLTPIPEKCRYTIDRGAAATESARRYLEDTCQAAAGDDGRCPAVLIHYQGNTSAEHKNLSHELVRELCCDVLDAGAVPVILDWDRRSPLPDGKRIHNPHADMDLWRGLGTGDAEVLAALTEMSRLMIGVDSGPLHVAAATSTPTIGVWTRHHPLHYIGLADHVTHLVPRDHQRLLRANRRAGEAYFHEHYAYQTYDDLSEALRSEVGRRLGGDDGGLVHTHDFWVRAGNVEQDLVVVGDVLDRDTYRVEQLPMPRPVVVDVGAHIGCFSRKVHQRNPLARIFAVECCPENIAVLDKNIGHFATVIQAAVTYEPDVALLSSVYPHCTSTGGSAVLPREELQRRVEAGTIFTRPGPGTDSEFWADLRPLRTVTLEQILEEHRLDRIDVLKLDCEESEYSILRNTTILDRIGIIVGEYHHKQPFLKLVEERFPAWDLRILKDGDLGTFWLVRKEQPKTRENPQTGRFSALKPGHPL